MTNNRVIGVKKSQFVANETIPANATLDFVANGQNLKITFQDFLTNLGVTGSLVQAGDPLGVPVLDPQGSVNAIRNLEEGFGIALALSGQNGIEISTAFTFDTSGAVLVDDPNSPSPTFRSLVAGDGIAIAEAAGQIQIATSEEPVATKTVLVSTIDDLPVPVLDVIQLADDTQYFFRNDVNLGVNRLVFGTNCAITSDNPSLITLTYTGTGTCITFGVGSNNVLNITIDALSATMFGGSGAGTGFTTMRNMGLNCTNFGVIDDMSVLTMRNFSLVCTGTGVQISNTITGDLIVIRDFFVFSAVGAMFDLQTSVWNSINLEAGQDNSVGAAFLAGLPANGNLSGSGVANVNGIEILGGVTSALSGISEDDLQYNFRGNNLIRDTRRVALVEVSGSATVTTIGATGVPQILDGTYTTVLLNGFTADATGRVTNAQDKGQTVSITVAITALRTGGGGALQNFTFFININGTVITASGIQRALGNSDAAAITLIWEAVIEPGEYVEVWVQRDENTNDVIGQDIKLRLS